MARTDTDLLITPSIEVMLNQAREEAERARVEMSIEAEARALASLTHCPSCKTRLSPIDAKMGNCLACGKSLTSASGEAKNALSGPAQYIVHI
jgi:hypothetical protein